MDTLGSMNTLIRTSEFDGWLQALQDLRGKAKILSRMDHLAKGQFGDCKAMGKGLWEMRIDHGPGYRVYFTRRGSTLYLLLTGGDKGTQRKDIAKANALLSTLPKE